MKQQRADEIMAVQLKISAEFNRKKVGQVFKVLIDRVEGDYFIGRTEFDSPDVDNEVLVKADYLRIGEFVKVKIAGSSDYDLYGEPVEEEIS